MPHVPADERRQQLVDATLRVVAREGMANATTRRIAQEAGASTAAIHYCFSSKEDLYLATYKSLVDQERGMSDLTGYAGDLPEAAARILTRGTEWAIDYPDSARVAYELTLWAGRHHVDGDATAVTIYELSLNEIYAVMVPADQGNPAPSVGVLARLVIAIMDGLLLQWFAHEDTDRFREDTASACVMLRRFAMAMLDDLAA
nr:TetR/AcrR family transcriptional regulator [Rhodococcus sp. (in: high G+C Gram-positive bacteria)]